MWRGWASLATANDYQRHYLTEVAEHLRTVSGFRGARLLRQEDGREVMFTSITFFTSLDAVRVFAAMPRGSAQIRGAVHWLIVGFLHFDNQQDCCH